LGFGETWPALLVAWGIGMLLRPLLDNIFARPRSKHENPPRTQSRHADDHRAVRHRHRHAVLLDNLGWLDLDLRMHILPTVLIGAGILKAMQTRTQSGIVIGGLMIVAGCLILLKEMGLIYIGWNTLWPLLMIGAGIAVVFKSNINRSAVSQPPAARWTRRMANRASTTPPSWAASSTASPRRISAAAKSPPSWAAATWTCANPRSMATLC
jgi:hypothetical protein